MPAGYLYVDGIVGDVGHGVLRDRRVLAEEGVVVVIVTRRQRQPARSSPVPRSSPGAGSTRPRPRTCSRSARQVVRDARQGGAFADADAIDIETLQRVVRRAAGRFVNERTSAAR